MKVLLMYLFICLFARYRFVFLFFLVYYKSLSLLIFLSIPASVLQHRKYSFHSQPKLAEVAFGLLCGHLLV